MRRILHSKTLSVWIWIFRAIGGILLSVLSCITILVGCVFVLIGIWHILRWGQKLLGVASDVFPDGVTS